MPALTRSSDDRCNLRKRRFLPPTATVGQINVPRPFNPVMHRSPCDIEWRACRPAHIGSHRRHTPQHTPDARCTNRNRVCAPAVRSSPSGDPARARCKSWSGCTHRSSQKSMPVDNSGSPDIDLTRSPIPRSFSHRLRSTAAPAREGSLRDRESTRSSSRCSFRGHR